MSSVLQATSGQMVVLFLLIAMGFIKIREQLVCSGSGAGNICFQFHRGKAHHSRKVVWNQLFDLLCDDGIGGTCCKMLLQGSLY